MNPKIQKTIIASFAFIIAVFLFFTYSFFFCRVDVLPGSMVIVTQKIGSMPPNKGPEQVLVPRGYRGIWEEPLSPGRHYIYPYAGLFFYSFERYKIPEIKSGKIGIVTSRGGKALADGRILAKPGEKGTWRQVLGPGWHLLNPRGFDLEIIDETMIEPGYVGVLTTQEGELPPAGRLSKQGERGIQAETLPPGRYYVNPREYTVDQVEVGYRQIMAGPLSGGTADVHLNEPVEFNSLDGFKFNTTVSVLLLYRPEDTPKVVQRYGNIMKGQEATSIENKIVIPQILTKIKEEGQKFHGRELITGTKREVFQDNFAKILRSLCDPNGVRLIFSHIRRIDTEDRLKDPIRKAKLAILRSETIDQQRVTAETETQLNISSQMIDQGVRQTEAQYSAQAGIIDASSIYQTRQIEAETSRQVSAIRIQTASTQAQIRMTLGQAEADTVGYLQNAISEGKKLGVEAFGGNTEAYRVYAMSEALNSSLAIRIRETGVGTLWTDLNLKKESPANIQALKELSGEKENPVSIIKEIPKEIPREKPKLAPLPIIKEVTQPVTKPAEVKQPK